MENSIEEDIKIIEDFILKTDVDYSEYNEQIVGDISYQAIQHLLSDYKRVLKENEELKIQEATQRKINELLVQRYSNSISVQEVKDKIEDLENRRKKYYKKDLSKAQFIKSIKMWGAICYLKELQEEVEKVRR